MLDPRSLKAFHAAATTLNFTQAARHCAMTQSGISQHIAKLEKELATPLFERINRKVVLTRAGELLFQYIEKEKEDGKALREAILGEVKKPAGLVRYAMPHSCLFAPHLGQLMEAREQYPDVNFEIRLCRNDEIFDLLLKQHIDFGFVTKPSSNPALHFETFCNEEYVLVANRPIPFKQALNYKFVSYPGMFALFEIWSEYFLPEEKQICPTALQLSGRINSLSGAITMVEKGLGLTVLPKHCILNQIQEKHLFVINPTPRKKLTNAIRIVTLKHSRIPFRVKTVLDSFWKIIACKSEGVLPL